jgi:hypothetical protein
MAASIACRFISIKSTRVLSKSKITALIIELSVISDQLSVLRE